MGNWETLERDVNRDNIGEYNIGLFRLASVGPQDHLWELLGLGFTLLFRHFYSDGDSHCLFCDSFLLKVSHRRDCLCWEVVNSPVVFVFYARHEGLAKTCWIDCTKNSLG